MGALTAIRTRLAALLAVDRVGQAVDQLMGGVDSSADGGHGGNRDGVGVLTHDGVVVVSLWLIVGVSGRVVDV